MHDAMPDSVDVAQALNFSDARIGRRCPADGKIQRRRNVSQGCREFLLGRIAFLHRDDGLCADSFDFPAQEANVDVLTDPIEVGGDDLKLQTRAAGIENKNIHGLFFCLSGQNGKASPGLSLEMPTIHWVHPSRVTSYQNRFSD